jgi:hypothetical protein
MKATCFPEARERAPNNLWYEAFTDEAARDAAEDEAPALNTTRTSPGTYSVPAGIEAKAPMAGNRRKTRTHATTEPLQKRGKAIINLS